MHGSCCRSSTLSVAVHHVVVAVGAWLQPFCDTSGFTAAELCPGKGAHLVLEQPAGAPLTTGLVVRHPGDGRLVTLSPWHDHLLLGSTDAECDPSQLAELVPTQSEVEYLLEALRASSRAAPATTSVRSLGLPRDVPTAVALA
jgi:glycerol-3-phosphate dehydrogenase